MLVCIGTVDNFILMPSPVLDESEQGFHLEQRLQVTLQAAANERQLMIEFRTGEGSDAPSEQLLNQWLESGDLVEALCTGLTARPFMQNKDKTYRRQGKEVKVGDETAYLDTMVVFAGASMSLLTEAKPIDDAVKAARASYKRGQREYRAQRNAERVKQMESPGARPGQADARAQGRRGRRQGLCRKW